MRSACPLLYCMVIVLYADFGVKTTRLIVFGISFRVPKIKRLGRLEDSSCIASCPRYPARLDSLKF